MIFRRICKRGLLVVNWKCKHFWPKNKSFKNKTPVIYLHLKHVVCFYINPHMEFKKCIGLFQCTVVPRIPEFSPDSSILAFWGQDANVTRRVNKFSFKAKWFLLKLQGKQSNSQKGISWKRKRLKTVNKIEAKRTSNATREHATLIGIGLRWCWRRSDSVADSVGFLARTEKLCGSCNFFG